MFKKKVCKRCGEKMSKKYSYCPYCGNSTLSNNEDWGMLGKKDSDPFDELPKDMFGGISGKMLNKMLSGAMKMLEKEMQKSMTQDSFTKTNVELYVNGKKINPENIKVIKKPIQETKKKTIQNDFSKEALKNFSNLPKEEPSTNVRRLSNKVIYEINIPGVKSVKDISIVKLENSIEIKAVAKDKAYAKVIAIDLPLKEYKLENEKLVLELETKN